MSRIPVTELRDPIELEFRDDLDPCIHVPSGVEKPADYDRHVLLDTVHDGWAIPDKFVGGFTRGELLELDESYRNERD
jgi:hypothetical protein